MSLEEDFPIDLGPGWRARIDRDETGEPTHVALMGPGPLGGAIPVSRAGGRDRPPVWHLVSESPLTLAPSIDFVGRPGGHGFVRDGRWVPA